jgi:exodeoxyribonuclease-3
VRVASWNVNSLRVRLAQVLDWIEAARPDVLALQETKVTDEAFPRAEFEAAGYHAVFSGQKTYNGVALLSRLPAEAVLTDLPTLEDPQRRILAASIGPLRVLNLYVVNGQAVGSEKYAYKLDWLSRVTEFIETDLPGHPRYVVLGDFNIAPEDRDVHDPQAWRESILCSTPEREALGRMLALGFEDSFRRFEQPEAEFSWWDYRAAGFRRNLGLRIDLILASKALAPLCTGAFVDKGPRRLERPSDHAPVVADFALEGAA